MSNFEPYSLESMTRDLEAPFKSLRLFAIEWALRGTPGREVIEILERHSARETDEECLMLLNHALQTGNKGLRDRIADLQLLARDPDSFWAEFSRADVPQKLESLQAIVLQSPGMFDFPIQRLLESERNPLVQSFLIRNFSKFLREGNVGVLRVHLLSPSLSVRIAALEVLAVRKPAILEEALPGLLKSDDPRIRSLAIRALYALDFSVSLPHLEEMLFKGDVFSKRCVLTHFLFLPLEKSRPTLIKFLAVEEDSELLKQASIVVLSNPDPEIPFILQEMTAFATHRKAVFLKGLAEKACEVIKATRLEKDFDAYLARLNSHSPRRALNRYVEECVFRFATPDWEKDLEFSNLLFQRTREPQMKGAFEEALNWPLSQLQKEALRKILGRSSPGGQSASGQNAGSQSAPAENLDSSARQEPSLEALSPSGPSSGDRRESPASQTRHLDFDGNDPTGTRKLISKCLLDGGVGPEAKAAAFRAASKLGLTDFLKEAERELTSRNPLLQVGAIKYLEKMKPEKLFPFVGRFMNSGNIRVRTAALGFLKRQDPLQAVNTVFSLLGTVQGPKRLDLMGCLVHLDFNLTRENLTAFLQKCSEEEALKNGLCLFEANPSIENLFQLIVLERTIRGSFSGLVRETRMRCQEMLVRYGFVTDEEIPTIEKNCIQRFEKFEREKKATSPFSLATIKGGSGSAIPDWLVSLAPSLAIALLFMVLYLQFGSPGSPVLDRSSKGISTPLSTRPLRVNLVFERILPATREVIFKSSTGEVFSIPVGDIKIPRIPKNKILKAVLYPYQKLENGTIMARLETLEL